MKNSNLNTFFKLVTLFLILFSIGCTKKDAINPNREAVIHMLNLKLDSIQATLPKSIKVGNGIISTEYKNGVIRIRKLLDPKKIEIENLVVDSGRLASPNNNSSFNHNKKKFDYGYTYAPIPDPSYSSAFVSCTAEYYSNPSVITSILYMDCVIIPAHTTEIDPSSGLTTVMVRTIVAPSHTWNPYPPAPEIWLSWTCEINYRTTIFPTVDPTLSVTSTSQSSFEHLALLTPAGIM